MKHKLFSTTDEATADKSTALKEKVTCKVGSKLLLLFTVCMLILLVTVVAFVNFFNSYLLMQDFLSSSQYNVVAIKQLEQQISEDTAAIAADFSSSEDMGAAVFAQDKAAIASLFKSSHINSDMDLAIITSDRIIGFASDDALTYLKPDSSYISDALGGKSQSTIDVINNNQIYVVSAAPIYHGGAPIGAVAVYQSLSDEKALDALKASSNAEYSIICDKVRMATTIEADGIRQIGTVISNDIYEKVNKNGEAYSGKARIGGNNYAVNYQPLLDHDGVVIGSLFSGRSLAEIEKQTFNVTFAAGAIAVLLLFASLAAICFALKQMIVNPLNRMVEISQEIALGHLDCDESYEYNLKDEVGKLYSSQMDILHWLQQNIGEIKQATAAFTSGSNEISVTSEKLAQGAAEQAGSIEQLNASLKDVYTNVSSSAENVRLASEKASEVSEDIEQGYIKMQELIASMGEITSSSNQIGEIIKTVDDIASQANILALNAAVEAAKAGAAGKGFAVVADGVRNLAQKSAETASNTTALIKSSVNAVEISTQTASDTSKYMSAVLEGSKVVAQRMGCISAFSEEQATAMEQIHIGMEQISSVVQTNSASAQESAATAEELSAQAVKLNHQIAAFRLKD